MIDWGDLRYFVAVARAGSTLGASHALAVSQTTVARRVSALEEGLGLKLIERVQKGSRLTDQGLALLAHAERVEAAAVAFFDAAAAERRQLSGIIRFTTTPDAAERVLGPPIAAFMRRHPGVRIELKPTIDFVDIAAGEADVALRAGPRPADPNLIVRKVADLPWSVYCSPSYAEARGVPNSPEALAGHAMIGPDGQIATSPAMRWWIKQAPDGFAATASTIETMGNLARSGLGLTCMPTPQGDRDRGLVRCMPDLPGLSMSMWIVTREDVRRTPHVRAFIDMLADHVAGMVRARTEKPA